AQAEAPARRNEHELGGHTWAFVVADLSQEGQVEAGEAVALAGAAGFEDGLACTSHERLIRRDPDEREREVSLDGRGQMGRAARIDGPAAIVELVILNITRERAANRVGLAAEEGQEEDVLGLEDRVAFELANPVAGLGLALQEPVGRALQCWAQS